jgi:hypothetical protein
MDPTKSEEEKFAVWRDAMNPELSDEEVMDLMHKAEQRMKAMVKPKKVKAVAEAGSPAQQAAIAIAKKKENGVSETPIDGPNDNPMIYGHQGANPAELKTRIMRARGQIKDLSQRSDTDSLLGWESIARQFPELAMNIEQIRHAIEELSKKRKKGGIGSRGIDPNIGEEMMPASNFSGSKKNKLGPAGQLKATNDHARAGDLVGGGMEEEKQRLDPKCWKGYKKSGTKMKGGVRVNNCVPVSEDIENIMDTLINKIIVNEAIQNNSRKHTPR